MLSQEQRVPFKPLPGPKGTQHAVFGSCRDHSGRIWSLFECMLIHVRLLGAMLGPYSCQFELMLSQERRVPFKPLPGPEGTRRVWIMSGPCSVYGAYAVSMLIHVRLLEAMLGPYWSHVELILSQERRVPFDSSIILKALRAGNWLR